MPTPAPTAAPPNFYASLPGGGAAPAAAAASDDEKDMNDEAEKALTGVIRVLIKVGELKKELKAKIQPIKAAVKDVLVNDLKRTPTDADMGENNSAESPAKPAAAPKMTDETHAA